jgi:hypothetical protein
MDAVCVLANLRNPNCSTAAARNDAVCIANMALSKIAMTVKFVNAPLLPSALQSCVSRVVKKASAWTILAVQPVNVLMSLWCAVRSTVSMNVQVAGNVMKEAANSVSVKRHPDVWKSTV